MKKLIVAAIAMGLQAVCSGADFSPIGTGTFTALPAQGDTVTVNGSVRTFVTNVTSAATQVLIGATTNATASNWWTQLQSYPYTDVSSATYGAKVFLAGRMNASMTASKTGSWGTIGVTNQPFTNYNVTLPWESIPPAYRQLMANHLINAISTYPTNQIPAAAAAMAQFMNLSQAQSVMGRKNFEEVGLMNAYINNGFFYGPLKITNAFPYMTFFAVGGDVDEKMTMIQGWGDQLKIAFYNDDGTEGGTVLEVFRNGSTPTGFHVAPPLYPQGGIDGSLGGIVTNVTVTNSVGHFTTAFMNSLKLNGDAAITNNAVTITLHDSGGTADDKTSKLIADGDAVALKFYNDAGTLISTPFSISRTAGVAQTMSMAALLDVTGNIQSSGDYLGQGNAAVEGIVVAGSSGFTAPTGATSGFYGLDSTAASADPATGFFIWSESGLIKYRTSTASEGSGGSFTIHNRVDQTVGSGSDYTLTSSTAAVDFGGTDPTITLPTPGTYIVTAEVCLVHGGTLNDDIRFKLRNTTLGSDVSNSDAWTTSASTASYRQPITISARVVTTTTSNVIALYGHNNTAARGTVEAVRTRLNYVREY